MAGVLFRCFFLCIFVSVIASSLAYQKDRVRLSEVQVFTAQRGHFTNARRVTPIPQMNCVGGSAGCSLAPNTMQCYNRGWDGRSMQWECKADLDESVKFGSLNVLCEGYDHPGDDYVLSGSCGVEFTLEPTGKSRGDYSSRSYDSGFEYSKSSHKSTWIEIILFYAVIGILIYAVYVIFFRGPIDENAYSSTGGDYPPGDDRRTGRAPPPGFRPEFGSSDYNAGLGGASCGGPSGSRSFASNLGGFWSGAATGGMLGYMFGSRNRGYESPLSGRSNYAPSAPPTYRRTSSSPGISGSGSTRSASGFGGTSVR